MPVRVVGRSSLMTELLISTFRQGGYDVGETAASVYDLKKTDDGDIVVMHALETCKDVPNSVVHLGSMNPNISIVVLCAESALQSMRAELALSVNAILPDTADVTKVLGALSLVSGGLNVVHPSQMQNHVPVAPGPEPVTTHNTAPPERIVQLSIKEGDVLGGVKLGLSNKAIGQKMGIKEATVKVHLRSIFQKIGVKNRTQAALWGKTYDFARSAHAEEDE